MIGTYSENGVLVDLTDVAKVIDHCDVFAVGFRVFAERLIVDTRHEWDEGPLIEAAPPVASVQERFFWLGQKRPHFGAPERFTFFVWPHSISFFEATGIAQRILDRCLDSGWSTVRPMFQRVLADLYERERIDTLAAIKGENYHTIWPPQKR